MSFFFFNDPATTEIYTLSLHDALPISGVRSRPSAARHATTSHGLTPTAHWTPASILRSEEHTSELQSRGHLVCRLLLEKKKRFKYVSQVLLTSTLTNVVRHAIPSWSWS